MSVLPVLHFPHSLLGHKSRPVDDFGEDLAALANAMLETMYVKGGIGLAAPQVGQLKQVVVVDLHASGERERTSDHCDPPGAGRLLEGVFSIAQAARVGVEANRSEGSIEVRLVLIDDYRVRREFGELGGVEIAKNRNSTRIEPGRPEKIDPGTELEQGKSREADRDQD